jgi:tripartite-type tricarboxylate transporter receptor subunit TctC
MLQDYRRRLIALTSGFVALLHFCVCSAQSWPERPVRIINPFAVGAGSDLVARLVADKLAQRFGKTFVVDNRPGANAIIGTDIVAKSAPDGYTFLAGGSTTHPANRALFKSLPYDPVKDFTPVAFMVSLHYYLVVANDFPGRAVRELIDYAKANPAKVTYGTGNATSTIAAELLNMVAGTGFAQVNYKGNTLAAIDVISGSITTMFLDTSTAHPFLQSGKVRALAVAAGKRSAIFPNVPTMAEAGFPEVNLTAWNAVWGPAKLPRSIVDSLNSGINAALAMPDVRQKMQELGFSPDGPGSRPEDLAAFVRSEIELWARVVKQARIQQQ